MEVGWAVDDGQGIRQRVGIHQGQTSFQGTLRMTGMRLSQGGQVVRGVRRVGLG